MATKLETRHGFRLMIDGTESLPSTKLATYNMTTTSDIVVAGVQVVGTTHELISIGDASDTCYLEVQPHATATISVGTDATGSFVSWASIAPGDPPLVLPRVAALANVYLKSSAASTTVKFILAKIAS